MQFLQSYWRVTWPWQSHLHALHTPSNLELIERHTKKKYDHALGVERGTVATWIMNGMFKVKYLNCHAHQHTYLAYCVPSWEIFCWEHWSHNVISSFRGAHTLHAHHNELTPLLQKVNFNYRVVCAFICDTYHTHILRILHDSGTVFHSGIALAPFQNSSNFCLLILKF